MIEPLTLTSLTSLRQDMAWERQQKNGTINAAAKRQQSATSLPALRRAAITSKITGVNTDVKFDSLHHDHQDVW